MIQQPTYLFPVGIVVGFHGLAGQVKVRTATNSPELLLDVTNVVVHLIDGLVLNLKVQEIEISKRMLLVQFSGYVNRTQVECLSGAQVFADHSELRPLSQDEWWVQDLIGLKAFTTSGAYIGTILSIIDRGTQLLEITSSESTKTILVPFVKELVPTVDIRAGIVEIVDLPGLLEPQ